MIIKLIGALPPITPDANIQKVLAHGNYIMGPEVEEKPGRLPIFSFRKIGSCTGFSGPQAGI